MTILLPALAAAFAAFGVWLTVRIVNRREKRAKRTAVLLLVAVSYPLTWGVWLRCAPVLRAALLERAYRAYR